MVSKRLEHAHPLAVAESDLTHAPVLEGEAQLMVADHLVGDNLCTGRNRTVTEWASRGLDTPIAVARYVTADMALTQKPPCPACPVQSDEEKRDAIARLQNMEH